MIEPSGVELGLPALTSTAGYAKRGQLALVLHAHLPFVRHPEHPQFHEETWLFEAILETYLPLVRVLEGWARDQVPGQLTLSVSPTLAAMLADGFLRERFRRYLHSLRELAAREEIRAHFEPARRRVAAFYEGWLREQDETYQQIGGDLLAVWARHARAGRLELITCSATHATLPLLRGEPGCLRAQLDIALAQHARWAGVFPTGFWLPECAWTPELEPFLTAAGIRWFVLETHGVLHATPRPRQAVFAPVLTPAGLAVFGRDPASARQVWSRHGGYPGDPAYREFHRDVAHDAEWEYVRPYLHGALNRSFTGLKFHRVTGMTAAKELYDREQALQTVAEHAEHFVGERIRTTQAAGKFMARPPLILAPYDAELFGHWWFEGPEFIDAVVRKIVQGPCDLQLTTPTQHLAENPELDVAMPAPSTWGDGGHFAVWLDESNAWMQGPLRNAGQRFQHLVAHFGQESPGLLPIRLLTQAGRELLLAQASDWPFLVKLDTAGAYPARRFREHLAAFDRLADVLASTELINEPPWLADLEARHNLFPDLDWRLWLDRPLKPAVVPELAAEAHR